MAKIEPLHVPKATDQTYGKQIRCYVVWPRGNRIHPTVRILDATPGLIVTQAQLDERGILAPPEPPAVIPLKNLSKKTRLDGERTWPDYERCVSGAPPNQA